MLAERLDAMLDLLTRRGVGHSQVPVVADPADRDVEPLETPVEEDFRVAVLRIAWDGDADRVLIEAASEPAEDDDELSGDVLAVRITGSRGPSVRRPGRVGRGRGAPALPVLHAAARP